MPRKKIEIDLAQVEACAARGLSMEKIALAMGISLRTLTNRKTENALVAEAIKRGRAQGEREISDILFEAAKSGQAWAVCFYLKCRCGWRETQQIDLSSTDGSMTPTPPMAPIVNIDFAAMPQEQINEIGLSLMQAGPESGKQAQDKA